ncbi:ribosome small subunit-dependent GTPase A [Kitasatospora sp. HPMI-4]|uniref:ribosome small subunit-dependent GTPase A n=1 Tax=Kitasatospora sp. HPMI-4 TaxID=3448443 RepID=UPI003F1DCE3D
MNNNSSNASALSGFGWDEAWAAEFTPLAEAGLTPARVARVDRGQCDVVLADPASGEPRTVRADSRPVLDPDPVNNPCTGDWVAVDLTAEPMAVLAALLPRRTAIVRKGAGGRSDGQVLAANTDSVLIAVSLATEPDLSRIERFLALAWESGAEPLVVLTKADLVDDAEHIKADVELIAPGVTVLAVSAETGEGMDVLRACLGASTALIGQSGAGKSTLTNALTETGAMAVQHIRDRDGKGRHTTTTRELIPLPGGGVVIDTPGLRGVGLFGGDGLRQAFGEIEELAEDCRFHDCGHNTEPGCAVQAALADGTLSQRRWESYRKLQRENEWNASRTDARLAAARLQRFKTIAKTMRGPHSPTRR